SYDMRRTLTSVATSSFSRQSPTAYPYCANLFAVSSRPSSGVHFGSVWRYVSAGSSFDIEYSCLRATERSRHAANQPARSSDRYRITGMIRCSPPTCYSRLTGERRLPHERPCAS
ncbi:MAG: hypothetical protein ACK52I_31975, partial [Pseudomonadota bacterium]